MKKLLLLIPLVTLIVFSAFRGIPSVKLEGTVVNAVGLTPLKGVYVSIKSKSIGTYTDEKGHYTLPKPEAGDSIEFSLTAYNTVKIRYSNQNAMDVRLEQSVVIVGYGRMNSPKMESLAVRGLSIVSPEPPRVNTESYASFAENRFVNPRHTPLSTFGVDVDAASYSNVRRFINLGQLPPADAVRVEEMINYFRYDYAEPKEAEPFSVSTELSISPWNQQHKLLRIGLQAKRIDLSKLPASNLVLLIDVSGSMNAHNKLPLVKSSMKMLINQLRPSDKVSIVTYAGAATLVLKPTSGKNKKVILEAVDELRAGGSTAGEAGIKLAYELAASNFISRGNNRVVMASDGDFNTGQASDVAMQKLIEEKRKSGIYLSVLGFGMGNYKDSKMEILADKGNGNYAYIDNISEGRKVLVTELGGTLFTVASDLKLQVEFNPSKVQAYRLIGYENRMLNQEDFKNDLKDAGDMGAGHSVTALYEIIPVGVRSQFSGNVEDLRYADNEGAAAGHQSELGYIRLRYKAPGKDISSAFSHTIQDKSVPIEKASSDFRFSAAVAGYGMLLKKSEFIPGYTFGMSAQLASSALDKDDEGFRSEFVRLVKASSLLAEDLLTHTEN
ncbi:MAG: YfbK domain-containing protein [Arcticibacter sp.]